MSDQVCLINFVPMLTSDLSLMQVRRRSECGPVGSLQFVAKSNALLSLLTKCVYYYIYYQKSVVMLDEEE